MIGDPLQVLDWLRTMGFTNLRDLNPCVPGEFTLSEAYYVNTATPNVVYRGSGEGTLPLVAGRWFLIPGDIAARLPAVTEEAVPVARAVSLSRQL
jgi:hypothetical protein